MDAKDATKQDALLAIRTLQLLLGIEEVVISIGLIKPLIFLVLALSIISFFLEVRMNISLPPWANIIRILAIAVSLVILFSKRIISLTKRYIKGLFAYLRT